VFFLFFRLSCIYFLIISLVSSPFIHFFLFRNYIFKKIKFIIEKKIKKSNYQFFYVKKLAKTKFHKIEKMSWGLSIFFFKL